MVDDPEPGAGMELGLKLTVTLLGWPLADKEMAELKPPEIVVVMVEWPEFPGSTVIDVGDALMAKLAGALVTISETATTSVMPPDVPATLIRYVPMAVDEPTVIFRLVVPAPVIELGLKATVTPVGWPVADKEMLESKPLITVLVIVNVAELPCTSETAAGEAVRPKPGTLIVPSRALTRPLPCGLPQPVAKS